MEYSSCKLYESDVNKIISGIRVADCMVLKDADEESDTITNEILSKIKDLAISNVLNCSYCNVSFNDAIEQRSHFKLDWHRYNLKRALNDKLPVTEDAFDNIADDISSLSGSESDRSEKDSDSESNDISGKKIADKTKNQKCARGRHSKAFFVNDDENIFSVYKCLLCPKKEIISNAVLLSSVKSIVNSPKRWLIIMLGGGHFAAAVFDNGVVAQHKTFHCYTVRAKQGGSQSSRDNKGGSHPRSAGASLRRFNEQALVQVGSVTFSTNSYVYWEHVQEIMNTWSETVKQCQLILYRATGPYNRGVLFGGKNPPLEKSDPRLRNIPFPTRRATFSELKRVYDILATVEVYGSAADYQHKYPQSPDKRGSPRKFTVEPANASELHVKEVSGQTKKKSTFHKIDRSKARSSPEREIPGEHVNVTAEGTTSESEDNDQENMLSSAYVTIALDELEEYADTVPSSMKEMRRNEKRKKRSEKSVFERQFKSIQRRFLLSCEREDKNLLKETLKIYHTLPEAEDESIKSAKGSSMTKKDFMDCVNSGLNIENRNTALHMSAIKCLPEFITLLLEAGADPTVKNKNRLTPYVVSGNKETKNSFKEFVSLYPDKFDYKKANIPEPLTQEMLKVNEKKKKEVNRMKREKDKMKKKENREKREEEKERERFLALSDREKCALAAERRMIASVTANVKSVKPPVLARCFQCGIDITGKVPFEYGTNRFCSIPCVKAHRLKTNSYGMEL